MSDKCAVCENELTSIEIRRIGEFVVCRDCASCGAIDRANELLKYFFACVRERLDEVPEAGIGDAIRFAAEYYGWDEGAMEEME